MAAVFLVAGGALIRERIEKSKAKKRAVDDERYKELVEETDRRLGRTGSVTSGGGGGGGGGGEAAGVPDPSRTRSSSTSSIAAEETPDPLRHERANSNAQRQKQEQLQQQQRLPRNLLTTVPDFQPREDDGETKKQRNRKSFKGFLSKR